MKAKNFLFPDNKTEKFKDISDDFGFAVTQIKIKGNEYNRKKFLQQAFAAGIGFMFFNPKIILSQTKNSIIMSYTLPELPYAYDALEPHFDKETMTIHHQKHHQGYVNKLNDAVAGTDAESKELEDVLKGIRNYPVAVRNNAGGHYNHSLFWSILSPTPQSAPTGKLGEAINKTFGSVDELKNKIKQAGLGQFGSGWAWLLVKDNGTLAVSATANQDNPLMGLDSIEQGIPILGVDVWEHAYYLKYQNKRGDYLDAFWKVVDWGAVEKKYEEVLNKIK